MTLEQLRIFVAVAEREHLTQAARALNLTQSAASSAVAALEARYQTRLFDRIGRRIALTEAGRLFLAEARAVLASAAAAETVLADLAGLKRGTVLLGASQTVGNYWLPALLQAFHARHPGIALPLRLGNTEAVAAWVQDGAVDLGFIEGEIDHPALEIEAVAEDELVLVVAPSHPWAEQPPASKAELCRARWVLREPGSATRAIFEAALAARGCTVADLDVAFELPSNEAVRLAVEAGAGATVISRLVVAGSLRARSLVLIEAPLARRQFFVVRHRERYASQAQRELLALARAPGRDRESPASAITDQMRSGSTR